MKKLTSDTQIMDWFRNIAKLVIESNDEYYITIEYSNNKYVYRFGDTTIRQDTEVKEMHEIEILEYIKAHYIRKAKFWHKKNIRSSDEVWNYIQENNV